MIVNQTNYMNIKEYDKTVCRHFVTHVSETNC